MTMVKSKNALKNNRREMTGVVFLMTYYIGFSSFGCQKFNLLAKSSLI